MSQESNQSPNPAQFAGAAAPATPKVRPGERWKALNELEQKIVIYSLTNNSPKDVAIMTGTGSKFVEATLSKIGVPAGDDLHERLLDFLSRIQLQERLLLILWAQKTEALGVHVKANPEHGQIIADIASGLSIADIAENMDKTQKNMDKTQKYVTEALLEIREKFRLRNNHDVALMGLVHAQRERNRNVAAEPEANGQS